MIVTSRPPARSSTARSRSHTPRVDARVAPSKRRNEPRFARASSSSSRDHRSPIVMFFHVNLERNITLEPRHFGARTKAVLEEKLRHEVRRRPREARDRRGGAQDARRAGAPHGGRGPRRIEGARATRGERIEGVKEVTDASDGRLNDRRSRARAREGMGSSSWSRGWRR